MTTNFFEFCINKYLEIYNDQISNKKIPNKQKETFAQKRAIRDTMIEAMRKFPTVEPADIWKAVYAAHMNRKSGITDEELIKKVVSAENSWKKSSGHAFEEMIKVLGNISLEEHNIRIHLQKDLKKMIDNNEIANEVRDISWLKEQIKASIFDLYISVTRDEKEYVYGCIQSKTSIRDRVTRDREPSINAMRAFFWSVAICLDGNFLKLPKFIGMVNGGTTEFKLNGWHGLYVFSNNYSVDRIYPIDINLELFTNHAIQAADYWLSQRQWFNNEWKAK